MTPCASSDPKNSALLEVGCEELPAALLPGVVESLRLQAEEAAAASGISFESIRSAGTPFRLILKLDGLAPETVPRESVVTGPPVSASGNFPSDPSPAARGFARTHGVAVEEHRKVPVEPREAKQHTGREHSRGRHRPGLLGSRDPDH